MKNQQLTFSDIEYSCIGIINYSKDGTHVVPARPKGGK